MGDELQVAAFLFVGLIILPALVGAVITLVVFLDETKREIMVVRSLPNLSPKDGMPTEKKFRKAS